MLTQKNSKERWRPDLPAGLENAIKQAEERGFNKLSIIDADCHQMEPFRAMAEYANGPLKSVFLKPDPEEDPVQKSLYRKYSGAIHQPSIHLKGVKVIERPEASYPDFQEADELVGIFTQLMQDIGIKSSIVLPTGMLDLPYSKPDVELGVTTAYMDYMLDKFLGKYPEILTLICVPTNTPDKAAEMIDRVGSEKGVVGIMISANAPLLAGSDSFDTIYQAAQQKELPVCFHGNRTLEGPYKGMEFVGAHALTFPFSLMRHMTSMILTGVPERFPKIKFVFMEGGITWIPWLFNRLDDEYTKRRLEAPLLTKLPSEYMKDFYYTSQPLEQSHIEMLEPIFKLMDFENHLLYASDYPHWDFDVPSVIYDLPFLSETAKSKILGENARNVFKLGN